MFNRILVALDASAAAAEALATAVQLASQLRSELVVMHVVDLSPAEVPEFGVIDKQQLADAQREGRELLKRACCSIPRKLKAQSFLRHGDPAETIIEAARDSQA